MRFANIVFIISLTGFSAEAFATLNASCTKGNKVRKVEITYEDPNKGAPCKVMYQKKTEDPSAEPKMLWNSPNNKSYCETKAEGFIKKLEGMGFACTK